MKKTKLDLIKTDIENLIKDWETNPIYIMNRSTIVDQLKNVLRRY